MFANDPQDALVPIFAKQQYSDKLIQIGTGIFVDFNSMPFLFTAAHVTDELENTELMIPVYGGIHPIEGYMAYVDLPPEVSRSEDTNDIAYYRLSTRFAQLMLKYFKPLPQSRCQLLESSLQLGICSVYGYPASKAKARHGNYSSETATYRGGAATQEIYDELKLSPQHNVVIRFRVKQAISAKDGSKMTPASPKGVSGGAILAWPEGKEFSDDWTLPSLVGIFHTYKKNEGLMIGTSLISIFAAIQLGQMKGFGGIT